MTPDDFDITLRLLAATVVGMIIGANRDLRGRPASAPWGWSAWAPGSWSRAKAARSRA
ncbi:hypothetical protein [Asticcacaulis sp. AC402]|uniref:hypothetical protein n=1 Tax=Asticcacaulis sp. AC402 TaxID=1282361 RepID=UPI0003C3B00D|nr:hypothetical protein [Asticcacaulis sp. AC402]ESQ75195.1 hypothetical protein ABAC402_11030 [Asticcacaulis sp. AC402]